MKAPGGGHILLLLQPDEHHGWEGQGSDQGLSRCLTEGLYDLESLNEVEQVNILTRASIVTPYAGAVLSVSPYSEEGRERTEEGGGMEEWMEL